MKIVFAPDSFKGSLTALEITDMLTEAALRHFPNTETVSMPLADGGEGTVDAFVRAGNGSYRYTDVSDALMRPVRAAYGLIDGGKTAVIEMAQASGLPLVPIDKRDPRRTSSYGTGEIIRCAIENGAKKLLIGIGGSATNDGGMGMLCALGAKFSDASGSELKPRGENLAKVARVDFSGLQKELYEVQITVICDVTNPLLGENGATYIYGPQKGATPAICAELEAGMSQYARVVSSACGHDIANFPGAGAAGGLGAALGGVLGARLKSGIDTVLDAVNFDNALDGASLVITGEGRIDRQSVSFGKVPAGVAKRCAAKGVPVVALVGGIGEGACGLYDICESSILSTVPGPITLDDAMQNAKALYINAADRLFRTIKIGMRINN